MIELTVTDTQATPAQLCERLTACERRTVRALAETGSLKGAAMHLGIKYSAVNDRLKSAYRKLGVKCAVRAAVIACKGGLA